MKELSIEEKAKAYDEAKEKAKIWQEHLYDVNDKDYADELNYIFPALKESEDEQHRKWILEYLYDGLRKSNEQFKGQFKAAITWFEKQGKQKSNIIVPRFEVGDLVINTITKEVEQVIELTDTEYICSGHLIISFTNEGLLKKWTIQDAKDGDVLAADECYVIFKEIDGLNIKCYCTYHYMGFNQSFRVNTLQNKDAFHPATKEQREQLEKAMANAGYTFDFDKKELKKIEPDEWNEEDIYKIEDALFGTYAADVATRLLNKIKSIRPQNTWKPSDEQMKALYDSIPEMVMVISEREMLLNSLYKDLRKLREEKL